MDGFELAANLVKTLTWPAILTVGAFFVYRKRAVFGTHVASTLQRLSEFKAFGVEIKLAERKDVPRLSSDIKTAYYKRYTNGILVQRMSLGIAGGIEMPLVFPISFPNEVLSFQFVGCAPLPIKAVTNGNFVLDATGCRGPAKFDLIVTGM